MPVDHYTISAICPNTGKKITLKLSRAEVGRVVKNGPRSRYYELAGTADPNFDGSSVYNVLNSPAVIFEGIRRFQKGGQCYCGVPPQRWTEGGNMTPPPPGMVFAVYVNPGGWIYDWRWEKMDPSQPEYPVDFQKRFKEVLWHRT